MQQVSQHNFGILIAYVIPGFTAIIGASYFSETIAGWLSADGSAGPTVGGFLYVTLASVAAGLTANTVRWGLIDSVHHRTGIPRPRWNYAKLQQHFSAYDRIEQNHYRFYQYYGSMVLALAFFEICRFVALGIAHVGGLDLTVIILAAIFFAGSRDSLKKFYDRTTQLLAEEPALSVEPAPSDNIPDDS